MIIPLLINVSIGSFRSAVGTIISASPLLRGAIEFFEKIQQGYQTYHNEEGITKFEKFSRKLKLSETGE